MSPEDTDTTEIELVTPDALPSGYADLLVSIKERVRAAQVRAMVAVNSELVLLYHGVGRDIAEREQRQGWGARVVERLSRDLKSSFPEMKGFSPRNLRYMRDFAVTWSDESILQGVLAKLTWYHNVALLEKVKEPEARLWYARATIENGWSRNVLALQIVSRLHERQGKAVTNFDRALPAGASDLAQSLLKDPYNFDFLTLSQDASEREIERGLLENVRKFLMEMGAGFSLVGSQYHLEVDSDDYYLDLLFYHLKLRCFVVIDLKAGAFVPEYAGKMNFYLSAVDDTLRHETDTPSIGLILCRERKRLTVEYALRGTAMPVGVAEFVTALPDILSDSLPSAEALVDRLTLPEDSADDNP